MRHGQQHEEQGKNKGHCCGPTNEGHSSIAILLYLKAIATSLGLLQKIRMSS